MALLQFNKKELVNLSYSLKREILCTNPSGAYCNTSIVTCNTRRYHGLLAAPIDEMGGQFLLLSSLDESLQVGGRLFNLGIHCYGDIYEPRGHKYIVDFDADVTPSITYKVGDIILKKTLLMPQTGSDQLLIKYELVSAPREIKLLLKPFLAFREIHALTHANNVANAGYEEIDGGAAFCLYPGFPSLNLQFSKAVEYKHHPDWYNNVTYSDEYRRGFDCREDLLVPGVFTVALKKGDVAVVSASTSVENPRSLTRTFNSLLAKIEPTSDVVSVLKANAETLKHTRNGQTKITAGYSWLYPGLLRETIAALPGLTLYANGSTKEFEKILDNLIKHEDERLYHRTTQIESPLQLTDTLQQYIAFGADERHVWTKYGKVLKNILVSYLPGHRAEVHMDYNGLLWAHKPGTALTFMNAYVNGVPVTERPGYQVEVNAFWYNAICFALEMEQKYGSRGSEFVKTFTEIRELVHENFQKTFYHEQYGWLADYVYGDYKELAVRPNMLYAVSLDYIAVDDEVVENVMRTAESELLTRRGMRTLSPRNPDYKGVYEGTQIERDLAYKNGSVWPLYLAPYVKCLFDMAGDSMLKKVEWLVEGFAEDIALHGVGCFSELYDGDPPHEPHGAISSAMSVSALLRINYLMQQYKR